ncbi:hypothetical protein [Psychrobacter sp. JCM 18901]|uniref:hypothetical protein n=1 Tax=Psychrobacter sp. JCM 18901 TaxID=1298609 RepID=UPI0004BC46C7|nr:hypothetical protein [Psychrobacter sp. JCM 18901]
MDKIAPAQREQSALLEQISTQSTAEQLKKIGSALRALRDAVILLNNNDGLEWWNQAAQDLLLLQPETKVRIFLTLLLYLSSASTMKVQRYLTMAFI